MITMVLWGIALVVAVVALRRNRQWWLIAALGIASVGTIVGWVGEERTPPFTVAAADAPGFAFQPTSAADWAAVSSAFAEAGVPDCTSGNRLSRKFDAASTAPNAFVDRLTAGGYEYEPLGHGVALMDALGGGDFGGGNTVFRAANTTTGHAYFGAWVIAWGAGRLFMCEGA